MKPRSTAERHVESNRLTTCPDVDTAVDRLLNRVVKAGLRLAAYLATDDRVRMSARRAAGHPDTISDVPLSTSALVRAQRAMDRRVLHCASILQFVEILWSGTSLDLGEEVDRVRMDGYLFNMLLEGLRPFSVGDRPRVRKEPELCQRLRAIPHAGACRTTGEER